MLEHLNAPHSGEGCQHVSHSLATAIINMTVVKGIQQIHGADHLKNEKEFQAVYFTNDFDNL
jgi:hypothetical protein